MLPAAPELVRLFQDEACQHLRAGSSPFWICVAALSRFVASNAAGALPLEVYCVVGHAPTALEHNLNGIYVADSLACMVGHARLVRDA